MSASTGRGVGTDPVHARSVLNNFMTPPDSRVVLRNARVGLRVKFALAAPGDATRALAGPDEHACLWEGLVADLPPVAPVVGRGANLVCDLVCADAALSYAVLARCAATVFVRERPPVRNAAALAEGVVLLLPRSLETSPWLIPST